MPTAHFNICKRYGLTAQEKEKRSKCMANSSWKTLKRMPVLKVTEMYNFKFCTYLVLYDKCIQCRIQKTIIGKMLFCRTFSPQT